MISESDRKRLKEIAVEFSDKLEKLENLIGRRFQNRVLLLTACIHSSFANENNITINNEKLEFLGDSVLSLILSEFLLKNSAGEKEGELAKTKSVLASEENLASCASNLHLEEYLLLGKGASREELGKRSNLADFTEALIGAIYLDGGLRSARKFVLNKLLSEVTSIDYIRYDPKSTLQERLLLKFGALPHYKVLSAEGPPHQKTFKCGVYLKNELIAVGEGRSKKEAEKNAALRALEKLGIINE